MFWVLASFFILLAIGVPIGYVLGIAGVLGILQIGGYEMLAMGPQRYFAGLDADVVKHTGLLLACGRHIRRISARNRGCVTA